VKKFEKVLNEFEFKSLVLIVFEKEKKEKTSPPYLSACSAAGIPALHCASPAPLPSLIPNERHSILEPTPLPKSLSISLLPSPAKPAGHEWQGHRPPHLLPLPLLLYQLEF
jgi:hypothetical protein